MRELHNDAGRSGLFAVPDEAEASAAPADVRARVVLLADDRRFRAVAATLLSQRGYAVAVGATTDDVLALALRERAEVVVIDATASLTIAARQAARLDWLRPRVGVVAVSADSQSGLEALPLLPKWGSFDDVFEAIDRARPVAAPAAPATPTATVGARRHLVAIDGAGDAAN